MVKVINGYQLLVVSCRLRSFRLTKPLVTDNRRPITLTISH